MTDKWRIELMYRATTAISYFSVLSAEQSKRTIRLWKKTEGLQRNLPWSILMGHEVQFDRACNVRSNS